MKSTNLWYQFFCITLFVLNLNACKTDGLKDASVPEVPEVIEPLTPVELCQLFEVYKSLVDPMNGPPGGPLCAHAKSFTHTDLTEHQTNITCRPGSAGHNWGLDLLEDTQAGRISVDWKIARTCISESLEMRKNTPGIELLQSEEWAALKAGSCTSFYTGNSQDGDACLRDWDCQLGSWCTSETPAQPETRVCVKERALNEACNDHLPCNANLACDNNICVDPMQDDRTPKAELGSKCEIENNTCNTIGDCIGCRPASASAENPTCELLGAEGDYCELSTHCVPDLGCTNNKCAQVGLGEMCMTNPEDAPTQSKCDADTLCIDNCWAYDGDEVSCMGAGTCVFSPQTSYCDSVTKAGECIAKPGIGDDCILGNYCPDSFCNTETKKCAPWAQLDEACIPNPQNPRSNCMMGYFCIDETCKPVCEFNEDCAEGEYCDGGSPDTPPACQPIVEGECKFDIECKENQYCDRCELQGYNQPECNMDMDCTWMVELAECRNECEAIMDETACGLNSACAWNASQEVCGSACENTSPEECSEMPSCSVETDVKCENAVECWSFSDETSCVENGCHFDTDYSYCTEPCSQYTTDTDCNANAGCTYDSEWLYCKPICSTLSEVQEDCEAIDSCKWMEKQYCIPSVDCIDFTSSDTACEMQESCTWYESGFCGPANPQTTFECAEKNPIGTPCRADSMCGEGGICMYDENQEPRCHYAIPDTDPSCNYTSVEFLRGAFLLGIVFAFRRSRRRKQ